MTHKNKQRSTFAGGKRQVYYLSLANLLAFTLISNLFVIATSLQVLGSDTGQAAAREKTGPQDSAVGEKDVRPLEQGPAVKRELSGGQRHIYRLRLGADQFLKAMIEQQGIDVVVRISGPDGKQMLEFDSERRPQGEEPVVLVAEAAGDYQLDVQPKQERATAGNYEIRIAELRAATDRDRALQEAYKLNKDFFQLYGAGKFDEAIAVVQRHLEINERIFGPDHHNVAATLGRLALLNAIKGEYAKAEALFQRSLLIKEKAFGPDHPDVASSLNNFAVLYMETAEYTKAEPLYRRALSIKEKTLGPDHPEVAIALNNLATLYHKKGGYAEAEPLYQRALLITEKTLGPDHRDVATLLNNLAGLYSGKGDDLKAEPLFQRALLITEKTLGPDHLDVARPLHNLANIYKKKGNYTEAEPLFKRALQIKEKALGLEHPGVALTLANLANFYRDKREYAKAEPLYQRVLSIEEKALGPEHPDFA